MSSLIKAQERAAALAERLKQAKARVQSIQARDRVKEIKEARATDTRRKVLLGAFVLSQAGQDVAALTLRGQRLGDYLKRDEDRQLFGLPPLAPAGANQPGAGPMAQEHQPQTHRG